MTTISDKRGERPLYELEWRRPGHPAFKVLPFIGFHLRRLSGQPLVVLTKPETHALCIEPDGRVAVRSLLGVTGYGWHSVDDGPCPITDEQKAVLSDLGLWPLVVAS